MGYKCELVIEKVKAKVAAAEPDASKRKILKVFEFIITVGGKEVKRYTIDLKKLEVYEGKPKDGTDVLVTVDDDALEKLLKKEIDMEDASKQGLIKVEGNSEDIENIKILTKKLIQE